MIVAIPLWALLLCLVMAAAVGSIGALLGGRKEFVRLQKREELAITMLVDIQYRGEPREGYSNEMLATCPVWTCPVCGHAPVAGHHAKCALMLFLNKPEYVGHADLMLAEHERRLKLN